MNLFLFAGEPSGDLHGEALMQAIRAHCPHLSLFGVGGPRMRAQGLDTVMEMERFQVMGFKDVAYALPRLITQFYTLRQIILKKNPALALFIDYPGFNLALEKSLRKKGFKGQLYHYICPSVWAWGKNRIQQMEATLDSLFVTLPFEKELFSHLPVQFVGHPLMQRIKQELSLSTKSLLDLPEDRPIIALFPGSRQKELDRNLRIQLNVAQKLLKQCPQALIALSIASPQFEETVRKATTGLKIHFVNSDNTYALMRRSKLAIAKSGTVTLELALHGVPTVMTYGLSAFDLFIARDLLRIRLPYYCIVNIILQEEVFPELIGPRLTEEKLFEEAQKLLFSEEARQTCREKCEQLHKILTDQKPAEEIAKAIKHLYR